MDTIGRYIIERKLGQGGMATVYLARDPEMDRLVAVKVLGRQFAEDVEFRNRFRREARLIASLDHSFIVPIYDSGVDNEQPYIVMRHMAGGTLTNRLTGVPWPLESVLALLERLGQALDAAHHKGIVHRDLKPDNVLFDGEGHPFLSDFGIAKLLEGSTVHTRTGIMGTPDYMSPEQAIGDKDLDARSDIYSLGVLVFQLLTGRKPFTGDTPMRVMYKHINAPIPEIETTLGLPPKTHTVLAKALAKQPEARYARASEFTQALQSVLPVGTPAKNTRPHLPPSAPRGSLPAHSAQPDPTPTWTKQAPLSRAPEPTPSTFDRRWLWLGLPIVGLLLCGGSTMAAFTGNWLSPPTATQTATTAPTRTLPPPTNTLRPPATRLPPSATFTPEPPTLTATTDPNSPTPSLTPTRTDTPTRTPTATRTATFTRTPTRTRTTPQPGTPRPTSGSTATTNPPTATARPQQNTSVAPTPVPPTAIPPTAIPPTAIPPTAVPPTEVPPTVTPIDVPPTVTPILDDTPTPQP